jgi:hypothetical protein
MIPTRQLWGVGGGTIMLAAMIGLSFNGCTVKVEPIKVDPITVKTEERVAPKPQAETPMATAPCPKDELECDPANKEVCKNGPGSCIPRPLPPGFTVGGVTCTWGNQCGNLNAPCTGGKCKNIALASPPNPPGGCMCACRP